MKNFQNRTAVITGAASGIGKAIAKKCLELGMKVVLADIDEQALLVCENELKSINPNIISVVTNVANEFEVTKLADVAVNQFGRVNFLFNNAGISGSVAPLWESNLEDIQEVLQVNLMGVIHGIKIFVLIMLKQADECHVINTSAGAGFLAGCGLSAYKASKHGITAISEVLFADLKKIDAKINVSVLIPHWVSTNIPKSIKTNEQKIIDDAMVHLDQFGMSPALVAEKVFAGILERKFYIFTHAEEHLPRIQKRFENILALENPC